MSVKLALERREAQDQILIGGIIKRVHESQYGEIFRALVEGLKAKELMYNQNNVPNLIPLTADRILGRLEAYQNIVDELDLAIKVAEDLQKPEPEEEEDAER